MIYLGTIALTGSDFKTSKTGDAAATATPFEIPAGVERLVLQPSAATILATTLLYSATPDGGTTAAAAAMLQLGGVNSILDVGINSGFAVQLVCRKTDAGAGTVKVFGVG